MAFYGVQGFSYDALGRLESAVYGENEGLITNPNRYNETVLEYTENGAIKRFQRRGLKQDNVYGKIDNLHISLDGNRVVHVDDDALPVARKGAVDFTDSGERQTEYTYNADGALTGDANRGIAKIDYDACGYPRRVQFMDGSVTEYVYTVTGVKLRTVHRTAVPGISVAFGQTRELTEGETLSADSTDYLGNLILEDGGPSKFLFEGGYCSFDSDGISYHYYDRDHQGNIRAVVNSDGTVEQIMNYYPFGTPFSDNTAMNPDHQPYKYNGKEFEAMHGRHAYDYGARFYDPLLPTWDRMDPLCEKYYHVSPYAYCANDPVNRIDVDGKRDYVVDADGNFYETTSIFKEIGIFFGFHFDDYVYRADNKKTPLAHYPEGTILNLEKRGKDYTKFEITNQKYADDLFQKLIRNSDVEWSNSRLKKGNHSYNILITTYNDSEVSFEKTPLNDILQSGYSLIYLDHSHPIPRDIKEDGSNCFYIIRPSKDDKKVASKYPNAEFRIYDLKDNIIYYYDHEKNEFKVK